MTGWRILPEIATGRRTGGLSLVMLVTERACLMQAANDPTDRTALFSLCHWLRARGIDPA